MMEGKAPGAMAAMWTFVGLVTVFMALRIYTRVVCVASYGVDDHIYNLAYVFLLVFTIFTQLSAEIGFGQTIEQLEGDMDVITQASLYECIGQGFAIVGMAIAKASMGFFLLRLVSVRWHQIAIWFAMALCMAASIGRSSTAHSENSNYLTLELQHRFYASGCHACPWPSYTTRGSKGATVR